MKKIIFITHSDRVIGGAEEDLRRLIYYFSQKSNEYDCYLFIPKNAIDKSQKNGLNVKFFQINSNIPPLHSGKLFEYLKFYVKAIFQYNVIREKIKSIDPDVIIFNSSVLFFLGFLLKKYKQVFFVREYLLNNRFRKFAFNLICKSSDLVVTVSNFIESELTKKRCSNTKTIYTSVDTRTALNSDKNIVEIDSEFFNFLSVGVVSVVKNQMLLIKEFYKLYLDNKKIRLYIIGKFFESDEYYLSLTKFISDKNLSKNVFFMGQLGHDLTLEYIKRSDCIVISSITEGMPNVISEAFMFGTPLISSSFPGVNEIVEEGINGLIYHQSELYMKMKIIYENEDLRSQLKLNSIKTFKEKFDLEENLKIVEKLIKKVVDLKN